MSLDTIASVVFAVGALVLIIMNQREVSAHNRTRRELCRLRKHIATISESKPNLPASETGLCESEQTAA